MMKALLLLAGSIISMYHAVGQSAWEVLSPQNGDRLYSNSSFINDEVGWVKSDSGLFQTQNGGQTWTSITPDFELNQFEFKTLLIGFGISANVAYKTNDGGNTWETMPMPDESYGTVCFLNKDTGFITSLGTIYKTFDGGETWSTITFGWNLKIRDLYFTDALKGFAVANNTQIFRTTDGGESWAMIYDSQDLDEHKYLTVYFINADTGFAGGYVYNPGLLDIFNKQIIERTTDGGESWATVHDNDEEGSVYQIRFRNAKEGFAVHDYLDPLKTTNGGASWQTAVPEGITTSEIWCYDGFDDFYAFGDEGAMFKLEADSSKFYSLSKNYFTFIIDHSFATPDSGWLIDSEYGILRTADGGYTWSVISDVKLDLIEAVSANDVIALAHPLSQALVYRSNDGGNTWNVVYSGPAMTATDLLMVNDTVGFVISEDETLWKTLDGGYSWQEYVIDEPSETWRHDLFFLNESEGWVVVFQAVYHTMDGGETWTKIFQYEGGYGITDVFFLDSQHGWVANYISDIKYYYTDDGGVTWTDGTTTINEDIYSEEIFFFDLQHGLLLGQHALYETTDHGVSWTKLIDNPGLSHFRRLEYVNDDAMFSSSDGKFIYRGAVCNGTSEFIHFAQNLSVDFIDQNPGATSWLWDFGDGSTSTEENPTHDFIEEGTFNVCLTAEGVCGSLTSCQQITFCELLNTDYAYEINDLSVHFSNLVNTADSFYWDFGDGITSTSPNPDHEYAAAGIYYACLYEFDVCGNADSNCKELVLDYPLTIPSVDRENIHLSVFPNPASSSATISFSLPEDSRVLIELLSIDGKEIMTVADTYFASGANYLTFERNFLASGMYLLKMKTKEQVVATKILFE